MDEPASEAPPGAETSAPPSEPPPAPLAKLTLDSISDGVISADAHGNISYLNGAAEQLTGWTREDAAGREIGTVLSLVDEASGEPLTHIAYGSLLRRETVALSAHALLVARDGRRIPVEDAAAPIRGENGDLRGVVVVFRDVTHQRDTQGPLSWPASHDLPTGLANRRAFEQHVARALLASKHDDHAHALLHIELSRSNPDGDSGPEPAAELVDAAMLKAVARQLRRAIRDGDVVARLGAGTLGVLLSYCQLDQARRIADEIRQRIKDVRFGQGALGVEVAASIGMIDISADSLSVSELMIAVDEACRLARSQGRDRIRVYSETDMLLARRTGEMMRRPNLTSALMQQRFVLYAMPISSLRGDPQTHQEVLLRMRDQAGKLTPPKRFMAAANRYQMLTALDRWVIGAVCDYLCSHRQTPPIRLSINLSASSLEDETLAEFVKEQLSGHQIDAGQLCFDIAETAVLGNLPGAQELMGDLSEHGCCFSLDRFGGGLSSFNHLASLPVDMLKIAGTLIRDIAVNPLHRTIVEAIHHVGKTSGAQTVAMFVEDVRTLTIIDEIGIDYAQGHLIGREQPLQ